ncbi:hypothetical protein NCER_100884 [Vairimorpha ceranae BRL01]|uniref:Cell apoptosis-related protein n=2 Tax=Vairimorpha ceranae TaxID=40302 RepID=C4V8Q0_VAIC1|nr:cell apoptosis-related protein [Vairimorpha ceranae]EEQ82399.1 hypothetical protein NCER_100884 [Vairimorpha ceranae BRL01]KAF5141599.1 hypothetical protein G9O61_00g001410 [Vairimorpha ceranae]KKO74643.1 cell apoptosis-related protein [Vairimorpha ceranae]
MSNENKNDEILRQILDDRSYSSFGNLKHLNKDKFLKLQDMILEYYNTEHKRISYCEYLNIINKLEELTYKSEIRFKRKNDMFDLSDIE